MTPGIRFHKFGWSFPAARRRLPVLTVGGLLPGVALCSWAVETRKGTDQSKMGSQGQVPVPAFAKGSTLYIAAWIHQGSQPTFNSAKQKTFTTIHCGVRFSRRRNV
jgi:hypothetical protein